MELWYGRACPQMIKFPAKYLLCLHFVKNSHCFLHYRTRELFTFLRGSGGTKEEMMDSGGGEGEYLCQSGNREPSLNDILYWLW